jgi:hypothetical protein
MRSFRVLFVVEGIRQGLIKQICADSVGRAPRRGSQEFRDVTGTGVRPATYLGSRRRRMRRMYVPIMLFSVIYL